MAPSDPAIAVRRELVAGIPLFESLTAEDLGVLAERFEEISFRKGDTVFREGDKAETFLVVARGELDVWSGRDDKRLVNRLSPGDHLGEVALLTEGRRTATVTAARAARLLSLPREDFLNLAQRNARLVLHIAHSLSRAVDTLTRGEAFQRTRFVVAVCGPRELKGKTLVAHTLAAMLGAETRQDVLVLAGSEAASPDGPAPLTDLLARPGDGLPELATSVGGRVSTLPIAIPGRAESRGSGQALGELLDRLGDRFPTILVDVPSSLPVHAVAEVSDAVVELAAEGDDRRAGPYAGTRVFRVLNLYNGDVRPIPISRCEPFVLPTDLLLVGADPAAAGSRLARRQSSPVAVPLERLARKLLGKTVGLALGGGAAFGLAHVGVLQVLEQNDIPADLLAGASMGSIVAMGYAAGVSPDAMLDMSRRFGTKRTTLSALDFTITRPGLLTGDRLKAIFMPAVRPIETFEQLIRPCQTVATDIESGELVRIDSGRIDDAFRASSSVPVLWSPVRRNGRTLVDGAVVDPVPVDVVREMGADVCLAVNVVPTVKKGVTTVLSRVSRAINSLNPFSYLNESRGMPNIFDIGMNALQLLQYELGNFKALDADVRVNIDASDFTWIEFYRAEELIERGRIAAEGAIDEMRQALARPSPRY